MYKIGICDDGKNIYAALEDMLFCYAKKKNIEIEVNVWYSLWLVPNGRCYACEEWRCGKRYIIVLLQ